MELKRKLRKIKLSEFAKDADGNIDVSRNVRYGGKEATISEADVYKTFEFRMLVESITKHRETDGGSGIIEPPTVVWLDLVKSDVPNPKYPADAPHLAFPAKGNRRVRALAESCGNDPDMEVLCVSIESALTPQEVDMLMMDHDQVGLRPIDFYMMAKQSIIDGMSETDFAERSYMVLPTIPGVKKPLTDKDKELMGYQYLMSDKPEDQDKRQAARKKFLDRYRGVIQINRRVAELPDCVEDAWLRKLIDSQNWPSTKEVTELHTAFLDDTKPERGKGGNLAYHRNNPGPSFQKRWQEVLDSVAAADEVGEARKSTGAKSRKELDALRDSPNGNTIIRTCFANATNTLPQGFDWPAFVKIVTELETGATVEQKNRMNALYGLPPIIPTNEAPKDVLGNPIPESEDKAADAA